MRVAGVDQSYTGFGFSIDAEAKKKNFPASKYDTEAARLAAIRDWFAEWLEIQVHGGLDLVTMEGYASAAKFGREMAGELGGVVKLAVHDVTGMAPLIVPPNSLKKFVLGKAISGKNVMLLGVFKKWGAEFSNDNQADAYALEQFGRTYLAVQAGNLEGILKYEIEAVEKVRQVNK